MARATLAMVDVLLADVTRAEGDIADVRERLDKVFNRGTTKYLKGKLSVTDSTLRSLKHDILAKRKVLQSRGKGEGK
jgi:hypothetical protein